jgi:WD40 repeat protein
MVRSIAFSPDARLLASSSMDDTVGLWDIENGHRQFKLFGHGPLGGRRKVSFLPGGKEFVSWGDDWYLRRWDVRTGKALAEHAIRPGGVAFAETDDGGLRAAHFDPLDDGLALAESVEFTSDASRLLISLGGSLYVFDVETGKQHREHKSVGRVEEALLTPDDRFVITREQLPDENAVQQGDPGQDENAWNTLFRVRDFESFEVVREIKLQGRRHYFPAISPGGRFLAHYSAGSPQDLDPDRWISVWKIDSATEYARITGFDTQPFCFSFSPDENRLASSHADTTLLVWELERFRKMAQ